MKSNQIIKQLQAVLPKITSDFTESVAITSAEQTNTILTLQPLIDGLSTDNYITISGLKLLNTISAYSYADGQTTITTLNKHDLTTDTTVSIYDTSLTEYTIVSVLDSNNFIISTSIEIDFLGQKVLQTAQMYNNQFKVNSVDDDDFTIDSGRTLTAGLEFYIDNANIEYGYRIYGVGFASAIDKYVESNTTTVNGVLTPTTTIKPALWVSLLDQHTGQKQSLQGDSTARQGKNETSIAEQIKKFEVVLTYPVNDSTGYIGMQYAEDLIIYLNKCLFGLYLPSETSQETQYALMPLSNNPIQSNGAIYQHSYIYEAVSYISNDDVNGDGVDDETFRFNDFVMQYKLNADDFVEVKKEDKINL